MKPATGLRDGAGRRQQGADHRPGAENRRGHGAGARAGECEGFPTDINFEGATDIAEAPNREFGAGAAPAVRHNVADESDWIATVERAREAFGGLSAP